MLEEERGRIARRKHSRTGKEAVKRKYCQEMEFKDGDADKPLIVAVPGCVGAFKTRIFRRA